MFESHLWKETSACSCMFATRTSFLDHYNIVLRLPASANTKRVHGQTSMRGLANIVSSVTRAHACQIIAIHACTRRLFMQLHAFFLESRLTG
jgi:hypothetical protein